MQIYHDTYCVIDIQQVIACSCLRLIRNYIRFGTKKLCTDFNERSRNQTCMVLLTGLLQTAPYLFV